MLAGWVVALIIVLCVIVIGTAAFLIWWFLLRKKKENPDRNMSVTCSTCGNSIKIDKYNPPTKIVCPNCGKEGPVKH
ncbi:MAG: hypothetical protein QF682_11955 [Candidatus Thermoplasmatota archaeon]|jgi:predicted permease|nr:hypothetical protein [Candidatus Thermoplasmatota archaeon]